MQSIYLLFYLLTFLTILFIGIYNLVYNIHCQKAEHELQVKIPKFVKKVLVINAIASFAGALILIVAMLIK